MEAFFSKWVRRLWVRASHSHSILCAGMQTAGFTPVSDSSLTVSESFMFLPDWMYAQTQGSRGMGGGPKIQTWAKITSYSIYLMRAICAEPRASQEDRECTADFCA